MVALKNPIAAPFYLIRVSGMTKDQALRFMASRMRGATCRQCTGTGFVENPDYGQLFCPRCSGSGLVNEIHTRREWHLDLDTLPAPARAALETTRYYEADHGAVRAHLKNKRTGETA